MRTMPEFKIYREHPCSARHRTYNKMGRCIWRRAAWVVGDGPYATLAHCRTLTVMLHATSEDARHAKAFIDKFGCGGMCSGRHEIIELRLD